MNKIKKSVISGGIGATIFAGIFFALAYSAPTMIVLTESSLRLPGKPWTRFIPYAIVVWWVCFVIIAVLAYFRPKQKRSFGTGKKRDKNNAV